MIYFLIGVVIGAVLGYGQTMLHYDKEAHKQALISLQLSKLPYRLTQEVKKYWVL